METYRLIPPVKALWRDGYKVPITSISVFVRYLAQPFGVNWAILPYSQITGDIGHPGIDIAVPIGERVFAAHDGIIVERDDSDDNDGLGLTIYDPIQKIQTMYWHNSFNKIPLDGKVKAGDLIALSGGSGKSYGPHLHFALYLTDEAGQIINRNNGYHGAIDPVPFFYMPVVDPKNMTEEFVIDTYIFFFGRLPDDEERLFWTGKNYRDLFKAMLTGRAEKFRENIG